MTARRNHKKKYLRLVFSLIGSISLLAALVLFWRILAYREDAEKSTAYESDPRAAEDYYCDLIVPESDIQFPVVKGADNEKYLHTALTGEESRLGAIFMDYRCGFDSRHIIIYVHDAQSVDGDRLMFGKLRYYLDENFIDAHPKIDLVRDGVVKRYTLFAVKATDINDSAYQLSFGDDGAFAAFLQQIGAPEQATEILTLSTCLGQRDSNMRLIVQAALL